jgi:hypothetical protein
VNKRSATLIAATLVGVLAIGGTAFSLGLTGPTVSAASDRTTTATGQDPIVRTHTKTIVVHRQAPSSAPEVVLISSSNSGPSASSGPGHEGTDDGDEDHGGDHEGEDDHGDHGDHEGEDDHGGDDD